MTLADGHAIVTGAAGFIGSHLVDALLLQGLRVTGIDNFVRGNRENLADARGSAKFTLLEADLSNSRECARAFRSAHEREPVRSVWHMAANSDIAAGAIDPRIDLRDTFLTTFHSLAAMRELGIGEFAFPSSSAVYGDRGETLTEDSGPLLPISNYGAMKLASEAAISAAIEGWLERAWIFRFPNVAGGRATHGVIFDLLRQLGESEARELKVLGDGAQCKPYLHVSELVEALLYIVERSRERRNVFNIAGTDDGATVDFIAGAVVQAVRPGLGIRYTGGAQGWVGDVPRFRYSTQKLQQLGWSPALSSQEAVRRAVVEIQAQMVACNSSS